MSALTLLSTTKLPPDYAVLPGGLYHRYTVEIIRDVAVVAETIALNV